MAPLRAKADQPLRIGRQVQFFVDDYLLERSDSTVQRRFHQARKHTLNPLISSGAGYLNVTRDAETGLFRMLYQTSQWLPDRSATYAIAYAESADGLAWTLPDLSLHAWNGTTQNNIVLVGPNGASASSPYLMDVPQEHRRGYRYELLYRTTNGMRVIGSNDGIRWDAASDVTIARSFWPDTQSSIVYDATRGEYVMHTRPTDLYPADGDHEAERRQVARASSTHLFAEWGITQASPPRSTQVILSADETDLAGGSNTLYGMPAVYHEGIYFGSLWPFNLTQNSDIVTELAISRDGIEFQRSDDRQPLIPLGPGGSWDDGMVLGGPGWVEVEDEWWIYYAGHDGPHRSSERTTGVGVAQIRKEGFASLKGSPEGGSVLTSLLLWPGGELAINATALDGSIQIRVLDEHGQVIPGYDYDDMTIFDGDAVRHTVLWAGSLHSLAGHPIRLEFELTNADLYSFVAVPEPSGTLLLTAGVALAAQRRRGRTQA